MTSYDFTMKLNRSLTPEDVEALYETGCSDAAVETGPLGTVLDFSRESSSLAEALVSAVHDIEKVPGLRAIGIACDNIVSLAEIAEHAGVSREAVRLWSNGQRGPGGFPAPVAVSHGGERGWDWWQVRHWLVYTKLQAPVSDTHWFSSKMRILCVADQVLAARQALLSEPDDTVRETFEELLQDA